MYRVVSVGWSTQEGLGGFVLGMLQMGSGTSLALKGRVGLKGVTLFVGPEKVIRSKDSVSRKVGLVLGSPGAVVRILYFRMGMYNRVNAR